MIPIASGVRIWIATGHTEMRRDMNGVARQVQEVLGGILLRATSSCSAAAAVS